MKLVIDTFSWKKIDLLEENGNFGMEDIIRQFTVCITHSVLDEMNHFKIKVQYQKKLVILPCSRNKLHEDALLFGFDEADASIVSLGLDGGDTIIISEDRPLLTFGKGYGIKMVQLIDFFKVMATIDVISRKDLYRINRELRAMKNISKHKEKSIKDWLHSHSLD